MAKKFLSLIFALAATLALAGVAQAETTIDADATWTGETVVSEDVVVTNGATLTIAPEAVVKMDAGANILITGGNLVLAGEAGKPAVITSNSATPAPSDWGHILVSSPSSTISINYGKVEYGGGGGLSIPAYIMVQSAMSVSIENSDLLNNNGSVLVYEVGEFFIHNSNIYNPDFCQDMGGTQFCGSSIFNLSNTEIDAINNYWGSNEGPTTDPAGDLKGTVIQGNVSYIPFLTIPSEPEIPDDPEDPEDPGSGDDECDWKDCWKSCKLECKDLNCKEKKACLKECKEKCQDCEKKCDCACKKHWWLRHCHHKHKKCKILRGPWGLIKKGRVSIPDCVKEKYGDFYDKMEDKMDDVKDRIKNRFKNRKKGCKK